MEFNDEDRQAIQNQSRIYMRTLHFDLRMDSDVSESDRRRFRLDLHPHHLQTDDLEAQREYFRHMGAMHMAALEMCRYLMEWAAGKGLDPQECLRIWLATAQDIADMENGSPDH